ncbi:DUF2812 domain-containing protein [Paenibacillus sp. FSL M7-1455]|uniref:DUF2812 domain-containing protein n=1 Tax=Paenibacillus cookii TaxID=157839 RepID=A0ABQ4LSH1_9BACL|nr:DUF2812 domain-containing protein [Paenibacillus cookii]GIO65928.1 hypothetical protein J21TS3_07490 [Paenibacillus cookii]
MGEHLEKRFRFTTSWNYEKEEEWLNELSAQGLHLKKAGTFHSLFTRNPSVRYTYRLDYQPGLGTERLQEYKDLYEDAGWEYVSSYKGAWHYFRTEWESGDLPKLYTDTESLTEHYKKIQRVIGILMLTNVIIFSTNMVNVLNHYSGVWGIILPVACIYVLLFGLLGYGYVKTGKKIKKITS